MKTISKPKSTKARSTGKQQKHKAAQNGQNSSKGEEKAHGEQQVEQTVERSPKQENL